MATTKGAKRPSKRTKAKKDQPVAGKGRQTSAPAAATPAPTAAPPGRPVEEWYRVTKWKGLDNYECNRCAYATLNVESAIEHYTEEHVPKTAEARIIVNTGIVSADGVPITRVVPALED